MFFFFVIASWVSTILLCTVLKKTICSYQENEICSGRASSMTRAPWGSHLPPNPAVLSITEQELLALQRTPTFQLWAEGKHRTMTRQRLSAQQTSLCLAIFSSALMITALTVMPFSLSGGSMLSGPTLWEIALQGDNFHSASTFPTNPYRICLTLSVLAVLVSYGMRVGMLWSAVRHSSRAAHSLVGTMATTDHCPRKLASAMDAEVAGVHKSEIGMLPRMLLLGGIAGIRLSHLAIVAYSSPRNHDVHLGQSQVNELSSGFVASAFASLLLLCG